MKLTDRGRRLATSLRLRLSIMLSIAILPLGVVAVLQTAAVVEDARELEERDILARTVRAANTERALLRRAYGAADALGASVLAVGADSPACVQVMRAYVAGEAAAVFAGFISADGVMRCSSEGDVVDFTQFDDWQDFASDPRPMVAVNTAGAASGQSVVIATVPVHDPGSGDLVGAASISLPHSLTDALLEAGRDGVHLALVDASGSVLSASTGMDDVARFESLGLVPTELDITDGGYTQVYTRPDGTPKLAVLVPLIADRIFVLGLWDGEAQTYAEPLFGIMALLFPIIMWIVALGVAIYAVDRLVLRHLRRLRNRMSRFSADEPSDGFAVLDGPPSEIAGIAEAYNLMVDRILADREELAENVREKELLLREVHHRVKNNLQLIASILNMQIRTVRDGSAQRILRRVQDRVMSLSSIHKTLYTGTAVAHVRGDRLLQEVVGNALSVGLSGQSEVESRVDLDPVELDPDQAVPLALLASELITNAIKYVGRPVAGPAHIDIRLTSADGAISLSVENSTGTLIQEDMGSDGTGLGARLIDAFVTQLGGEISTKQDDQIHRVQMVFHALAGAEDMDEIDDEETRSTPLARAS